MSQVVPLGILIAVAVANPFRGDDQISFRWEAAAVDGRWVSVPATKDPARATIVAFLGTECPLARLYGPRLSKLATEFASQGVHLIGVVSNVQDSPADIQAYARDLQLAFPLIYDEGQWIADQYGAERTPEVFLLDEKLDLRYRGRIDDQYAPGVFRSAATRADLRIALQELLATGQVTVTRTKGTGCIIGRARPVTRQASVTYCRDVAPILARHCVECHREGEIGPFVLDDYDEVVGWLDTMLEVVQDGRMPPWHANPSVGQFANARGISDEELRLLEEWAAAGTPYGNEEDLPPSIETGSGWHSRTVFDMEFPMRTRPFQVPADGTVEYQYFVVDPGFSEETWVAAADIIPGNRSVVHHCIVFIRPPDGSRFRGVGWLTAYVPGQREVAFPPGHARRIPAGSKLVFQMHYTPNGEPQSDITRVGLRLLDASRVTHEVFTLMGINQDFEIPPEASAYEVAASVDWLPAGAKLLSMAPHMHLRGKSFRIYRLADGEQELLLDVPRYDFNWQHSYTLARPLPLDDVDALRMVATFDNSAANPFNPDSTQRVTWGDQTWEEMAIAFFEVAAPRVIDAASPPSPGTTGGAVDADRVSTMVEEFFVQLDRNRDGRVVPRETSFAVRRFTLPLFDLNEDGVVTKEEVQRVAEEEVRP